MSDAVGKFFFSFHKGVVEVIEFGKLLIECHKLLVCAGLCERFGMQFVKFASAIEQFRKIFQSPKAHGFGEGIEEEERAVAVVDELNESAIAEFITQNDVGPQSDLIGRQLRVRIGRQRSTGLMGDGIDHRLQESVSTALGGLPQSGIRKA